MKDIEGKKQKEYPLRTILWKLDLFILPVIASVYFFRIDDRTNARGYTMAVSAAGSIVGYALLLGLTENYARFAAACVVAVFIYPVTVLKLTWAAMGVVRYTRIGSALVSLNIVGQVFPSAEHRHTVTRHVVGETRNAIALTITGCYLAFALILRWYYSHLNQKKRAEKFLRKRIVAQIAEHRRYWG
ncbi:hypothetical protein N7470_006615 [Penicillium chermesinum]|nr:hypothetical protein N7470_006615 [Penicillium chermesinum]